MTRTSWTDTFLGVADVIAGRSQCSLTGVGAVVVDTDHRIVSTGYNGPPRGAKLAGPCSGWCDRAKTGSRTGNYDNCPSIHAEMNALIYSDRSLRMGGTIYITREPCYSCLKVIANSGLANAVWRGEGSEVDWERHMQLGKFGLGGTIVTQGGEDVRTIRRRRSGG